MADLSRFRERFYEYHVRLVGETVRIMEERMKALAPVSTPTPTSTREPGTLRDSIRVRVVRVQGTVITILAEATAEHASYLDEGTGPHTIRARNAPFLRFWWESGPRGADVYYFRKVEHPGSTIRVGWWSDAIADVFEDALLTAHGAVRY